MPKYRVGFHYQVSGSMEVNAKSEKHAEAKVEKILAEEGIEDEAKVDVTDRDYGTHGIIKEYGCTK